MQTGAVDGAHPAPLPMLGEGGDDIPKAVCGTNRREFRLIPPVRSSSIRTGALLFSAPVLARPGGAQRKSWSMSCCIYWPAYDPQLFLHQFIQRCPRFGMLRVRSHCQFIMPACSPVLFRMLVKPADEVERFRILPGIRLKFVWLW